MFKLTSLKNKLDCNKSMELTLKQFKTFNQNLQELNLKDIPKILSGKEAKLSDILIESKKESLNSFYHNLNAKLNYLNNYALNTSDLIKCTSNSHDIVNYLETLLESKKIQKVELLINNVNLIDFLTLKNNTIDYIFQIKYRNSEKLFSDLTILDFIDKLKFHKSLNENFKLLLDISTVDPAAKQYFELLKFYYDINAYENLSSAYIQLFQLMKNNNVEIIKNNFLDPSIELQLLLVKINENDSISAFSNQISSYLN